MTQKLLVLLIIVVQFVKGKCLVRLLRQVGVLVGTSLLVIDEYVVVTVESDFLIGLDDLNDLLLDDAQEYHHVGFRYSLTACYLLRHFLIAFYR